MTLKERNRFIFLLFLFFFPATFIYIYAFFSFISSNYETSSVVFMLAKPYSYNLIFQGIFLFLCIVSAYTIFWNFRNTNSSEIFFFLCFLSTSSLLAIQSIIPFALDKNIPLPIQNICVKVLYFSHFLSLFNLLFSSFFKIGFNFNNEEWSFFIFFLLSFIFANLIPFDQSVYTTNLQNNTSQVASVFHCGGVRYSNLFILLSIVFPLLSFINYVIIANKTQNPKFFILGTTILIFAFTQFAIGFQLHFIIQVISLLLFVVATALFAVTAHHYYKWS